MAAAMEQLRAATSTPYHHFIADDISILDDTLVDTQQLSVPRQLTDVYLLALSVTHDARLVTLDTHIPLNAVCGAMDEHLGVI